MTITAVPAKCGAGQVVNKNGAVVALTVSNICWIGAAPVAVFDEAPRACGRGARIRRAAVPPVPGVGAAVEVVDEGDPIITLAVPDEIRLGTVPVAIGNQASSAIPTWDVGVLTPAISLVPVVFDACEVIDVVAAVVAILIAEVVFAAAKSVAVWDGARRTGFCRIEQESCVKKRGAVGQGVITNMLLVDFIIAVIVQAVACLSRVRPDECGPVIAVSAHVDVVNGRGEAITSLLVVITESVTV